MNALLLHPLKINPTSLVRSKFNVLIRMYMGKLFVIHACILSCNSYANLLFQKCYEPLGSLQELLKINKRPVDHAFYYFQSHLTLYSDAFVPGLAYMKCIKIENSHSHIAISLLLWGKKKHP